MKHTYLLTMLLLASPLIAMEESNLLPQKRRVNFNSKVIHTVFTHDQSLLTSEKNLPLNNLVADSYDPNFYANFDMEKNSLLKYLLNLKNALEEVNDEKAFLAHVSAMHSECSDCLSAADYFEYKKSIAHYFSLFDTFINYGNDEINFAIEDLIEFFPES